MPKVIIPSSNGVPHDPKSSPLKVFTFHGLELTENGGGQSVGECPFCSGEGKFYVKGETGQWDCKVCSERGNVYSFLRLLWERSWAATTDADCLELAADRRLVSVGTLKEWGVAQSILTGEWLVPGHATDGKLNQLYRYAQDLKSGKRRLYASPGLPQQPFGMQLSDPKKSSWMICEGPWDAMVLWECLRGTRKTDNGEYRFTNSDRGMLGKVNVIAVPGCNSFPEAWAAPLAGGTVTLLYDSDHPKRVVGRTVEPAGFLGMRRVAQVLAVAESPPAEVRWLAWGPDGFDPNLPSGTDLRDLLTSATAEHPDGEDTITARIPNLAAVLDRVEPIPSEWVAGAKKAKEASKLQPTECRDWETLLGYWRSALRWTGDLDYMLSMFLSSVLSTETKGEPVWLLAMAPPSSGKTTLCEALAVADKHVYCQNELHPVYSGYMVSKDDTQDHGIIPKINNKTFIVMDGDPILKDPNRGKILSQYRALFEGIGRKKYNNGKSFDYRSNFTFIIAGTNAMREMDAADLGGRWLSVCFKEKVDYGHRDEVARMIVMRESANSKSMLGKDEDSRIDPAIAEAKRRTGGYVNHLRQNAARIMNGVEGPDGNAAIALVQYGSFAACMRARPSKTQSEVSESEAPYRLIAQYTRLAMHLAGVMNKSRVDDEVLARVKRCALDTSRGRTMNIVEKLALHRETGLNVGSISILTGKKDVEERELLRYLREIGVVESFIPSSCGVRQTARWRLTERVIQLYDEVCGVEELEE